VPCVHAMRYVAGGVYGCRAARGGRPFPAPAAQPPRRDAEEPPSRSGGQKNIAERSRRRWQLGKRSAQLHGGEACVTISMSRAERADLGQRGAQPGAARRRAHAE
jgi:hypothetical protein